MASTVQDPSKEQDAAPSAAPASAPGPAPATDAASPAAQSALVSAGPGGAASLGTEKSGGDARNRANLRDKAKSEPYGAAATRLAPGPAGSNYAKSKDAAQAPKPKAALRPQPLPYLSQVQQAFGRHDISSVKAYRGDSAAADAKAMGAAAYTSGDQVVFGHGAEDLFTVAHEAAHVIQQRHGVSLGGGEGQAGDVYERHADAVAERVVSGQSAEDLLDRVPGGSQKSAEGKAAGVQKRVWVGGNRETKAAFVMPGTGLGEQDRAALQSHGALSATQNAAETWVEVWKAVCEIITVNPELAREGIEAEVKAKFDSWVGERSAIENAGYARPEGRLQSPERAAAEAGPAPAAGDANAAAKAPTQTPAPLAVAHTEQRVYPEVRLLATALIHESHPQYLDRLAVETELAVKVAADPQYGAAVRSIVAKLAATLSPEDVAALQRLAATSRYAAFSSLPKAGEILAGGGDIGEAIILLDEYNNYWKNKSPEFDRCKQDLRANFGDLRVNGWTVNEDNPWVKESRLLGVPLMAGPSGTTNGVMALGQSLGSDGASLYKVAWAMHAFFNGMWRGQSGTHRLHEVMAVAKPYCGGAFTYHPSIKELG